MAGNLLNDVLGVHVKEMKNREITKIRIAVRDSLLHKFNGAAKRKLILSSR